MALFRPFLALLTLATSLVAADQASPEAALAQDVIAKARAAVAKEPKFLERIKGLHFEAKSLDKDGKPAGYVILQIVPPHSRRQINYSADYGVEVTRCTNGLEGWTTQREVRQGGRSELSIIRFDEVARMKDMAVNDLTFYAAPDATAGTVTYKGQSEVAGRKVQSVQYTYKSGYNLIRHFDAQTNLLAATDYLDAKGEALRQTVDDVQWIEGVAFSKKESVYVAGQKVAEIIYEKVAINPEVSESSFAFPQR
jgi:hypothetical protein